MSPKLKLVTPVMACLLNLSFPSTHDFALNAEPRCRETTEKKSGPRFFIAQLEANFSFLGELLSKEASMESFAYSSRVGLRSGKWDIFAVVEHGMWRDDEGADSLSIHTLDLGLGAGFNFFKGNMRSSLAIGPSVLLTRSQSDEPGSTGFFIDFRPASFRWPLNHHFAIELHPITFVLVVPVITGIPLVYMSYRTALTMDFQTGSAE